MSALQELISTSGLVLLQFAPLILIGLMAVCLEVRFPKRAERPDGLRWMTGTALLFTGYALVILLVPVTSMAAAQIAAENGTGFLNAVSVPPVLALIIGFLLYDFRGYVLHRLSHQVPWLWRLHRTHHSDEKVDASTALRTHPGEVLLVSLVTVFFVQVLGVPPFAILLHFTLMQALDFWHHANIRPLPGQRRLGVIFNIPEFHEVHHSASRQLHDSNYGAILSIWDRMFGTLIDDPALDGEIEYGLDKEYWDHPSTLGSLLVDPIRK